MLQRIRDRVSGWIAGVIIALVAGAFILFGVEYYFDQGAVNQGEVAKINGVTITENQVNEAFSHLEKQMMIAMHGQPLTDALSKQLKNYALQSLVTQTALFTTFEKEGFRVGMPQIQAMIEHAPQFQDQGKFSEQKFMQTLYQANLSPETFFHQVQSQWLITQVTQGVAASAFVLPNEVNHWYGLVHQQRAFGYFVIPMKSFLSKVTISDEAIKNDYTQNQKLFETPAKVSVSYIVLSPTALAKNVVITEDEAKNYYQSHLSNYQIPERWQVSQITIPVAANASQTDINAAQSKAASIVAAFQANKETGFTSSTVTISAAEVDQLLHNTLTHLKLGSVSQPLRTANGFTLLKLIKTMPAETRSFDSVKNNLMELLQHQKINEQLTKKSSELADLTYTNPDSLSVAAKTLNLPIQTSPMLTKTGEKTGIFSNPKVLDEIFSDSVFTSGNNSKPINLSDGSQLVLRVAKKISSEPIPLDTVKAQIKEKLSEKQASAQAGLLAYQLQQKLSAGEKPDALAKQNGLQWHVVALTTLSEKSSTPQAILTAAFKAVGTQAVLINSTDYAVIAVNQIKNADPKQASAAVNQKLSLQLSALWGQVIQHCLESSVMKSAHIVMKQS